MSSVATLYTRIGRRIGDPNADEVATGAGSVMLDWINIVYNDVALLTDCFQQSDTVTGDATAESFVLTPTALTNLSADETLIRVINVVNKTSGITYRSVSVAEWHGWRNQIVVNSLSGVYVFTVFGYGDTGRAIHILPVVANTATVTLEYSFTETALATDGTPAGLLANYDEIFIEGIASIYFDASGNYEESKMAFDKYMMWVNKLNKEVGINPVIKPELSSLWRGDVNNK